MVLMRTPFLTRLFPCLLLAAVHHIHIVGATEEPPIANAAGAAQHAKAQIDWLRSRGGFVSSKIEIRNSGMFATGDFQEGENIIILPKGGDDGANVIMDHKGQDHRDLVCALARNLMRELKLGDKSRFSAYVNYLNDQPHGQLPSAWSEEGKKLLKKILGKSLPPVDPVGLVYENRDCINMTSPFEVNAMMMVLQRGWDNLLLPVYDMMSHRNGDYLNTESNSVHNEDEPVNVYASRAIKAGEELYTSYNLCLDCGNRHQTYGTPDIFRDYGFVEGYPQRWIFRDYDLAFEITDDGPNNGVADETNLKLKWFPHQEPDPESINYMIGEVKYLQSSEVKKYMDEANPSIPDHELDTIRQYVEAFKKAFAFAIEEAEHEDGGDQCDDDSGACSTPGLIDLSTYTQRHQWYWIDTCDDKEIFRRFEEEYEIIETINSPYQTICFFRDVDNNDMCFELDLITQICSSYRPHYHEMVVHYTARFLPKIERVLWVGGGDAMLLHEILKYPTLEFVVGLEIDQKVTRNAFKYFGSQPHWDNEKVQWWYGDAAKSLMMLPDDYFGSFDLVLVDLSETVMSHKVTDGLDIMAALGLLLKPEGILVKNEMYFEKMKEIYEHTVQVRFYDCPVICHQGLSLVSHHNPMISNKLTDHGFDDKNLFVDPLNVTYHHSLIHDYNKDISKKSHCKREDDVLGRVPEEQVESPGILMIVEAENISFADESVDTIRASLMGALEKVGLLVVSTLVFPDSPDLPDVEDKVIAITLEEGYVVAKVFAKEKYCAFDIHMWSSTWKQVDVKNALLSAVGARSSSQLRIVAGGMFGMSTWKEDKVKRGPRRTDSCEDTPDSSTLESPPHQDPIHSILKAGLATLGKGGENGLIAVVCGEKSDGTCQSLETLKKIKNTNDILPLWTCPGITDFGENRSSKAIDCNRIISAALLEKISGGRKLDGIILDPSVPMTMGGLMAKILNRITWENYCNDDILIFSLAETSDSIDWRPNFFKRFQTSLIVYEPVFRAEVNFNSTLELNILSTDEDFTLKLNKTTDIIEEETGLVADVTKVRGGHFHYQHEFNPTYFFEPKDYDQSSPFEQWNSQKPLERQVLFQLEGNKTTNAHEIQVAFEKVLKAKNIDVIVRQQRVSGEGDLFIALWSEGRAILLWDGRKHIDMNLILPAKINPEGIGSSNAEITSGETFDSFAALVIDEIDGMAVVLRDEQSRGTGRVVNFVVDIESTQTPHWML